MLPGKKNFGDMLLRDATRTTAVYVEVWELKLYFYPSAGGLKKKEKKAADSSISKLHATRTAVLANY